MVTPTSYGNLSEAQNQTEVWLQHLIFPCLINSLFLFQSIFIARVFSSLVQYQGYLVFFSFYREQLTLVASTRRSTLLKELYLEKLVGHRGGRHCCEKVEASDILRISLIVNLSMQSAFIRTRQEETFGISEVMGLISVKQWAHHLKYCSGWCLLSSPFIPPRTYLESFRFRMNGVSSG